MSQPTFNTYGAVDLSALRSTPKSAPDDGRTPPEGSSAYVTEVTEATFQAEVIDRSMTVPVVIDFWATWCEPCKQLSPILERLAQEYAGRWVLAKIDVDANQNIAQAAAVQSIPTIVAVLKGQPVPLFMGSLPEPQVRQYIDELLRVAAANGVTGVAGPAATAGSAASTAPAADRPAATRAEPQIDPRYVDAVTALEKGDLDSAAAAYRKVVADSPNDPAAHAGLATVELARRSRGVDPAAARRAADARPDDVAAQTLAADLEVLDDRADLAFARLIETVRRSSGADRDAARHHLLELFEVVGPEDPRVRSARGALASALF
jgi:putative thioredoxin